LGEELRRGPKSLPISLQPTPPHNPNIMHLVDILYPKGHSVCKQWSSIPLSLLILLKDRMVPSKDFHHSGQGAQAVKKYLTDTKRTPARLAGMF